MIHYLRRLYLGLRRKSNRKVLVWTHFHYCTFRNFDRPCLCSVRFPDISSSSAIDADGARCPCLAVIGRNGRSLAKRLAAWSLTRLAPKNNMTPGSSIRMKPPIVAFHQGRAKIVVVDVRRAD